MRDSETIDLLPEFIEAVKKLGFEEKPEENKVVKERIFVKDAWKLYIYPELGFWLLEGAEDDADGNFDDWDFLEFMVEEDE